MRVEPRERTIVMHAHGASRSKPSTLSGAVSEDHAMSPEMAQKAEIGQEIPLFIYLPFSRHVLFFL